MGRIIGKRKENKTEIIFMFLCKCTLFLHLECCAVSATQLKKITSGLEKRKKERKLQVWSVSSIQQTELTEMWVKNETVIK